MLSGRTAPSNIEAPIAIPKASARVAGLRVRYVRNGDRTYTPGFFDVDAHIFYRWNGVSIPESDVPCNGPISAGAALPPFEGLQQRIVNPPIDYVMKGGYAVPGYYDRSCQRFFQWKMVAFDPAKVSSTAFGRLLNWEDLRFETSTIAVPPHLQAFAESLKKTVPADRRK
jgi:hypothetical protein